MAIARPESGNIGGILKPSGSFAMSITDSDDLAIRAGAGSNCVKWRLVNVFGVVCELQVMGSDIGRARGPELRVMGVDIGRAQGPELRVTGAMSEGIEALRCGLWRDDCG